jgi:hypothetical protein
LAVALPVNVASSALRLAYLARVQGRARRRLDDRLSLSPGDPPTGELAEGRLELVHGDADDVVAGPE